jgi:hypothetical protein
LDLRAFYGYNSANEVETQNPVKHFARHTIPFPSILLNYKPINENKISLNEAMGTSPRSNDIPREYLDATAAHLCPMDYLSQSLLQPVLRSGNIRTITVEAHRSYLQPEYWNKLPSIVSGLTGFIVPEDSLRIFFRNRTNDIIQMMEAVAKLGCEMVVVHQTDGTRMVYELATGKKWLIPVYPNTRTNAHSGRMAFGGGMLAGYQKSYSVVEAVVYGAVTESIASEGFHPAYLFDTLAGLPEARLSVLREMVREI